MEISETRVGDVVVFGLAGHLDGFSTELFEQRVLKSVEKGERKLLLDMDFVEYISSVGLGALVTLHKQMKQAGGRVAFFVSRPNVQELVRTSGLHKLLDIHEDREQAMASAAGK
jgi:anti-anti-sigma factor